MAKKPTSRTAFVNKLKKRAGGGWSASRKKAAKRKGERLPDGIVGGIAKLTSHKGDLDKKGNPYFVIGGLVISPPECYGIKCNVMHFIRETKTKTVDDKLDELSSDLQLIGVETKDLDLGAIPDALEGLVEAGETYFTFNTWKPDNGDTMAFVQGLADEDEVAEAYELAGEDEVAVEDDEEPETDEEGDDEEPPEEDETEEDDDWKPEVDEVYAYKPSRGKLANMAVKSVQVRAKTVTLVRESDSKEFTKVSWDKLEDAE